jgi:hypothetical protein
LAPQLVRQRMRVQKFLLAYKSFLATPHTYL